MSLELLDKTSLKEKIDEIKRIYDELELKQKDFCSSFDIACIDGCGKCCENYTHPRTSRRRRIRT